MNKKNPVMVAAGRKAAKTRALNAAERSAAAKRAWKTIRANKAKLRLAGLKAWKTRLKNS